MSSYEKQMQWRKAAMLKTNKIREEKSLEQAPTFNPKFYSAPVPEFIGHARQLNDQSRQLHVERQSKARIEKDIINNKLKPKPINEDDSSTSIVITNNHGISYGSPSSLTINNNPIAPSIKYSPDTYAINGHTMNEQSDHNFDHNDTASMNSGNISEEPIVELLERERKQWREEREKLIQCIHLQQLELSQRSIAAHERAIDIAKEFARAVEGFEERLISVEGIVQREIMSIKSIAESLLTATNISNTTITNKSEQQK